MEEVLFFIEGVNQFLSPFHLLSKSSRDVAPPTVFQLCREMRLMVYIQFKKGNKNIGNSFSTLIKTIKLYRTD
jgi:hypothetical protein